MADHDLEDGGISGLRVLLVVVIGALAIIGFFSIIGTVLSTVAFLFRAALTVAFLVAVFWVLKAVFFRSKSSSAI